MKMMIWFFKDTYKSIISYIERMVDKKSLESFYMPYESNWIYKLHIGVLAIRWIPLLPCNVYRVSVLAEPFAPIHVQWTLRWHHPYPVVRFGFLQNTDNPSALSSMNSVLQYLAILQVYPVSPVSPICPIWMVRTICLQIILFFLWRGRTVWRTMQWTLEK